MKKTTLMRGSVVAALIAMSTGCSSLMTENYLTRNGSLAAQPMLVVTRPHEYSLDTLGDATGTARTEKFLFFTVAGDRPDVTVPIIGKQARNGLETLACYRAAKSLGGDAFYAVSSEWERETYFLGIYRKAVVTVNGKSLKLKDIGELSPERADKEINRTSGVSVAPSAVGFFHRIIGGSSP